MGGRGSMNAVCDLIVINAGVATENSGGSAAVTVTVIDFVWIEDWATVSKLYAWMSRVNEYPTVSDGLAVILSSRKVVLIELAVFWLFADVKPPAKRYIMDNYVPIFKTELIKGRFVITVAPNGTLIVAGIVPAAKYSVPNTPKEQIAIS